MLSPDDKNVQGNITWMSENNLDLIDFVSCDSYECKSEATHYAKVRCCGAVIFGCESCMHELYKSVIWLAKTSGEAWCRDCETPQNPLTWLSKPEKISQLQA